MTDFQELQLSKAFSGYIPGMTKFMKSAILLDDVPLFIAHIALL